METARLGVRYLAEAIIKTKFSEEDTILSIRKKFFKLMRKHGIKRGTKEGNGIVQDNFEWTMAKTFFFSRLKEQLEFDLIFGNIPKDLEC